MLVPPLHRLFFSIFIVSVAGKNQSSSADFAALYSLRASLGLRARDWPRRADPCLLWAGVGCDAAGRVVALDLYGLRRSRIGRQNPLFAVEGIRNLTRLASFNATGFTLRGSIPNWFGTGLPPSLAVLDLRRTSIFGEIPYSFGEAVGLTLLSLAENSITGDLPPTLGKLRNLSFLDLSRNRFSGDLPAEFAAISNIAHLDLSYNYLTGAVLPEIGYLAKLETLILVNNSFSGSIPPELGSLSYLVTLDLSYNSLSGALPDSLGNLRSIRNLNLGSNLFNGFLKSSFFLGLSLLESIILSSNNFSGELPDSLWSLSKLGYIDVSLNNFTGRLPEHSPANAVGGAGSVNFSHNLLYGPISSGFATLLSKFRYADLSYNYLQDLSFDDHAIRNLSVRLNCFQNASDQRTQATCLNFYDGIGMRYESMANQKSSPNHSRKYYIVIAAVAGIIVLVFVIFSILLCFIWRQRRRSDQTQKRDLSLSNPAGESTAADPPVGAAFTYLQLALATSDFAERNLIKQGQSGDIFHGVLENGSHVIIKRVVDMSGVKKEAFATELDFFTRFSHERLVPFISHCSEKENERFLVYRQMAHGDLSSALYKKADVEEESLQSLDWITRLKIATGAAEALIFLHHDCSPPLVHRDIQASSILLDDKFEVRLGSFSSVCPQEGDGHHNVFSRFLRLSQASDQSGSSRRLASPTYDIYCFGKVLLELVTGKIGVSASNESSSNEWLEHTLQSINIYEKELITKIVDPSLIIDDDLLEEVWAMAIVARSCLNPKPAKRPHMKNILKALENPLKVVREESDPGSARLRTRSSRGSWNAAAIFGSLRHSLTDLPSGLAQGSLRRSGSAGENSLSRRRTSKEIFPEPNVVEEV